MDLKVHGLTEKSNPKPILGYTDKETIKLDFDEAPFRTVLANEKELITTKMRQS